MRRNLFMVIVATRDSPLPFYIETISKGPLVVFRCCKRNFYIYKFSYVVRVLRFQETSIRKVDAKIVIIYVIGLIVKKQIKRSDYVRFANIIFPKYDI